MSRPGWDNASLCAGMRGRVSDLAATRWNEAYSLAAEIPLPWYRVQALAAVARAAPENDVDAILAQAQSEAARDTDAYRRIAVLTWIIEAAIARGRDELAGRVLDAAMAEIAGVSPEKSRAAALELLLRPATKLGKRRAQQVAERLLETAAVLAADPFKKWQRWGASHVNRTARTLAEAHEPLAERLLTTRFGAEKSAAILSRHSVRRAPWAQR